MADQKISALTELTGADVDAAADVLPIVDTGVTTTKKILVSNLLGGVFTTAGDIMQASGDGVAARLGIGTARQVPTVNAGATALAYANPITMGTEQATTSGTSIDFTSIPSGVRRITINFKGVSTNGTDNYLIQIGDSGGVETSGYVGSGVRINGGGTAFATSTAGLFFPISDASEASYGTIILSLESAVAFSWSMIGCVAGSSLFLAASGKSLSAELDRVRITTTGGSNTFDAGAINITYE